MDLNKTYEKMSAAGYDWADKKAAASVLESAAKAALSEAFLEARKAGAAQEEAKHKAVCDLTYQSAVRDQVEAEKARDHARIRYDSIKAWLEMALDANATKRAEMKLV